MYGELYLFYLMFSTLVALIVASVEQVKRLIHEQDKKANAGGYDPFLLRVAAHNTVLGYKEEINAGCGR